MKRIVWLAVLLYGHKSQGKLICRSVSSWEFNALLGQLAEIHERLGAASFVLRARYV
jgi:hypothetical protein